ncbi:MAG: helix-hairpin-helix domain-containing protein [Pseudomonadota bacterium]
MQSPTPKHRTPHPPRGKRDPGCAPDRDPCCERCDPPPVCELDCLLRPEFHCGQELTDGDLNALVHWTDRRLARVRYRDGWGVVCGFGLCIDPDCPTRVIISPGYAVSCCGDDLVLCETTCLDLAPHCPDPCLWPGGTAEQVEAEKKRREEANAKLIADRLGIDVKAMGVRLHGCVGLDICLEAAEEPVVSLPYPGGCGCTDAAGKEDDACWQIGGEMADPCATTRLREGVRLLVQPHKDRPAPHEAVAEAWDETLQIAKDAAKLVPAGTKPKALRDFLLDLGICSIGLLDRIIEGIDEPSSSTRPWRFDPEVLLFWVIIDRRLALIDADCHACAEDERVCLGRVWLFTGVDRRGRHICFIGWIEKAGPPRRQLSPADAPAPLGAVNLIAHALGREPNAAALALAAAGLQVVGIEALKVPLDGTQVSAILKEKPFASWARKIVLVYADSGHGPRVIGWRLSAPSNQVPDNLAAGPSASIASSFLSSTAPPGQGTTSPADAQRPGGDLDIEAIRVPVRGVGEARIAVLRERGIGTIADLLDADRDTMLEIVTGFPGSNAGLTPEALLEKMIEVAQTLAQGGRP